MEQYTRLLDWYLLNVDKILPVALSVFVMGLSLSLVLWVKDKVIRTGILIPVAVLFLVFSYTGNDFTQEYFLNLGVGLVAALIVLGFAYGAQAMDGWGLMGIVLSIIALFCVIFVNPLAPRTDFLLTLATMLITMFALAMLLRIEWKWSPQGQQGELWKSLRQARKEAETKQSEFGDYFILMTGNDTAEIEHRIDYLKQHGITILRDNLPEKDEQTGQYYRLVNGKIETVVHEPDIVFLSNQEARLRILGYQDTVKRIYNQVKEVIDIDLPQRIDAPDTMLQVEAKARAPQQNFSLYLEEQIFSLAREWRHSDDEHLKQATDDLLLWAKSMEFIQEFEA